jgi:hypothetical protein
MTRKEKVFAFIVAVLMLPALAVAKMLGWLKRGGGS